MCDATIKRFLRKYIQHIESSTISLKNNFFYIKKSLLVVSATRQEIYHLTKKNYNILYTAEKARASTGVLTAK